MIMLLLNLTPFHRLHLLHKKHVLLRYNYRSLYYPIFLWTLWLLPEVWCSGAGWGSREMVLALSRNCIVTGKGWVQDQEFSCAQYWLKLSEPYNQRASWERSEKVPTPKGWFSVQSRQSRMQMSRPSRQLFRFCNSVKDARKGYWILIQKQS